MLVLTHELTTTGAPSAGLTTLPPGGEPFLDYDPVGYVVEECSRCSDWRAEAVIDSQGCEVVREWHEPDCPALLEWL